MRLCFDQQGKPPAQLRKVSRRQFALAVGPTVAALGTMAAGFAQLRAVVLEACPDPAVVDDDALNRNAERPMVAAAESEQRGDAATRA